MVWRAANGRGDASGRAHTPVPRRAGMRDRLRDSTPRIRRHINVFVEGQRARLDTPLKPGAKVFIITGVLRHMAIALSLGAEPFGMRPC